MIDNFFGRFAFEERADARRLCGEQLSDTVCPIAREADPRPIWSFFLCDGCGFTAGLSTVSLVLDMFRGPENVARVAPAWHRILSILGLI